MKCSPSKGAGSASLNLACFSVFTTSKLKKIKRKAQNEVLQTLFDCWTQTLQIKFRIILFTKSRIKKCSSKGFTMIQNLHHVLAPSLSSPNLDKTNKSLIGKKRESLQEEHERMALYPTAEYSICSKNNSDFYIKMRVEAHAAAAETRSTDAVHELQLFC